jgi:hypothetical protein
VRETPIGIGVSDPRGAPMILSPISETATGHIDARLCDSFPTHHDPFCLCFTCREKQGNTDEEGNEFGLNGPVSDGRREGVGGYHRRETSRGVHSSGSRHGILWRHRIPGVTRKRPALPLPSTLISDFTLWRGTHSHVLTV